MANPVILMSGAPLTVVLRFITRERADHFASSCLPVSLDQPVAKGLPFIGCIQDGGFNSMFEIIINRTPFSRRLTNVGVDGAGVFVDIQMSDTVHRAVPI